jgi:hypothetical protein
MAKENDDLEHPAQEQEERRTMTIGPQELSTYV